MIVNYFFKSFKKNKNKVSIILNNRKYLYADLINKIEQLNNSNDLKSLKEGDIVAIESDYNLTSISLLFFLISKSCIVVPINNKKEDEKSRIIKIAKVNKLIEVIDNENYNIRELSYINNSILIKKLHKEKMPGLILFSSGSSGFPKGAVHNFNNLLEKFTRPRVSLITINFLLFDHWGGLNTMFHVLSNGGTLVLINIRTPEHIAKTIEVNKVELLPVSPTFLNMLILSNVYKKYDLDSLKTISYGTEPMPETTLIKLKSIFPNVKLQQTYGLIEVGVLRSKSKENDSLWVQVGGEGYKTRIKNGMLEIKSNSVMLGYLNAKDPFTKDGWYKTGDNVLEKNGFIKILGRATEVINVGGEKIFPQEIENEILKMNNIKDVRVYAEKNVIVGNLICADVSLHKQEEKNILKEKMINFLSDRISQYKIPVKLSIRKEINYSDRFKKKRL